MALFYTKCSLDSRVIRTGFDFLLSKTSQTLLKVPGRGNEIVGKGEPRSLASEGVCEVPHFIVSLAAGNAGPSGKDGLFDGHSAVQVADETLVGGARNIRGSSARAGEYPR